MYIPPRAQWGLDIQNRLAEVERALAKQREVNRQLLTLPRMSKGLADALVDALPSEGEDAR